MSKSSFPVPPPIEEESGELSTDAYNYILEACLRPKDRKNEELIKFVDAFVRCKNIAQASNEAGVHRTIGYRWRHRKDVNNAIVKLTNASLVKYGFDSSEIVERVKEVVDFDPIEMMNPDGTFKSNMHDIAPEARRCLRKLKVKNIWNQPEPDHNGFNAEKIIIGEIIEYEFYDKLKGAELVGREKELFKNTTRVEHDVTSDMANVLLASAKRADEAKLRLKKPDDIVEAEFTESDSE